MELDRYLSEHKILGVGNAYSDIVVTDPPDLIRRVQTMGYYINGILWWEHIEIQNAALSIGYGGPIDPQDAAFFFAETDISRKFSPDCPVADLFAYLQTVRDAYKGHDLYPSFTLTPLPGPSAGSRLEDT